MYKPGDLILGKYTLLKVLYDTYSSRVSIVLDKKANYNYTIIEYAAFNAKQMKNYQLLQQLKQSAIPKIKEVVQIQNGFLVVQEYVEGDTLFSLLLNSGVQKEEDVVEWAIQLCKALSCIHSQQPPLVFGKIRPDNIMLRPDGSVMLIEFDRMHEITAFEGDDNPVLGFSGYCAPEQYGFYSQIDHRADIYALGAMLSELVTKQHPHNALFAITPIRRFNPFLSTRLEWIIQKCTQHSPDNRFQSCEELLAALLPEDLPDKKPNKRLTRVFESLKARRRMRQERLK